MIEKNNRKLSRMVLVTHLECTNGRKSFEDQEILERVGFCI